MSSNFDTTTSPTLEGSNESVSFSERTGTAPSDKQEATAMMEEHPPKKRTYFPFFDLPAELRNRIYDLLLLYEGTISLRTSTTHIPSSVVPLQHAKISQVNQQSHAETKERYHSNEFIVNMSLDPTENRLIPERHLSNRNMARVRRLVIVVDLMTAPATTTSKNLVNTINFKPLEHLGALTDLTICAIAPAMDHYNGRAQKLLQIVIDQTTQYIPPGCTVVYGAANQETTDHLYDLIRKHRDPLTGFCFTAPQLVSINLLNAAAAGAAAKTDIFQGAKNLAYLAAEEEALRESMVDAEDRTEQLEQRLEAGQQHGKELKESKYEKGEAAKTEG